jgi:putative flippase GtrA
MFKKLLNSKIFKSSNFTFELFRTYIVGFFNLSFGLLMTYLLQFVLFVYIPFPMRTYLANITSSVLGKVFSYLLSRKVIFQLNFREGSFKEFINFLIAGFLNTIAPLVVWYIINLYNQELQANKISFVVITSLTHGLILPIKYFLFKFFVFKSSLKNY